MLNCNKFDFTTEIALGHFDAQLEGIGIHHVRGLLILESRHWQWVNLRAHHKV